VLADEDADEPGENFIAAVDAASCSDNCPLPSDEPCADCVATLLGRCAPGCFGAFRMELSTDLLVVSMDGDLIEINDSDSSLWLLFLL
jgi:hypothetical protein